MIFIFGFGHIKKDAIGPIEERTCTRCNNHKFWILEKVSEWFTLFFIPIFKTHTEYYKYCPICGKKIMLSKEAFDYAKPTAAKLQKTIDDLRVGNTVKI